LHLSFSNKVVVITGGTRGIGAALVDMFQKSGAYVITTGTKRQEVDKLNNSIQKNSIKYCQLDFSSDRSLQNFLEKVDKIDQIDVLINNAGVNKIDSIDRISRKDWDWINAVNLRGPFLVTRTVSRIMRQQKYGRIINISSIFSVVSKEKRAAYSTTKWGLLGFTKAVALDLVKDNILVNAVSPGFVDTELTRNILGQKGIEKLIKQIPQKRLAKSDEIAKIVLFLASDHNTYITGQNIVIDGGFTIA